MTLDEYINMLVEFAASNPGSINMDVFTSGYYEPSMPIIVETEPGDFPADWNMPDQFIHLDQND